MLLVNTLRWILVLMLVITTPAPATARAVGSVTAPVISPVGAWAPSIQATDSKTRGTLSLDSIDLLPNLRVKSL